MSTPYERDVALERAWLPELIELARRLRVAARGALAAAIDADALDDLAREHAQGAGDVTYGIDVPAERELDRWLEERARHGPLSLLTEDAGWRHMGPDGRGGARALADFDHGGVRIVVDPIDGTRNLMTDLRSAWSVIGLCGAGANEPRLTDVAVGVLAEIPDSRAARARVLCGRRGGASAAFTLVDLASERELASRALTTDADARADHGYFPFFRYMADLRPAIAAIEARFFERLAREEHADVRSCWDDQYISNGGQLALLALAKYRMIADLRAHLAARRGAPTLTCKPYDCAGAIVVARAAGGVVTAIDGGELDFPLDVHTPVSFVGWVNEPTRARLAPHLAAALRSESDAQPRL